MIVYLFKTILCSFLFLLVYSLFLEKEKMYRFNRFYLIGSLVLSLLIPLMILPVEKDTPLHSVNEFIFFQENIVSEVSPVLKPDSTQTYFHTENILMFVYWLVTAFFLFIFIADLFKLFAKIRRGKSIPYKESRLVLIEEELTPHSFLNYIFLNRIAFEEGRIEREILHHELTHVKQVHTLDILFIEFIAAFLWFNPFIFLFKRAVKLNHEFLADESVINEFQNIAAYQYLLLAKTNQQPALSITSQFNFLVTKKRLIMITRYTSRRKAILKQSFALIIMTTAIFIFSSKVILAREVENNIQPIEQLKTKLQEVTNRQDTTKPSWVGIYAGSTKDGVSKNLLDEYHSIINRNKTPGMSWFDFRKNISKDDSKRLEAIFIKMSLPQQEQEEVIFMRPSPPFPRVVPTQKQFNSFKNSKVYGLWVNEKKVPNSVLDKYSAKDFSHVFISKLYGAAKKDKTYSFQVDMMTNNYYEAYLVRTKADKSNKMIFRSRRPLIR